MSKPTFETSFLTTVDNTAGLIKMIETAVGSTNLARINPDITPERFKLGQGVRNVKLKVRPFLDKETNEECVKRLVAEGYTLENIGELAAFLAQHSGEVGKWAGVLALGGASRWAHSGGVYVPYARAHGEYYMLYLGGFHVLFSIDSFGVLVSSK